MKNLPLAFSPDPFHCDSSEQGSIIEHTTSWLTMNPMKGCPLECAYCFRHKWHPAREPAQVFTPEDSVRALMEHPEFVPHDTPISVNVSSTDAMLPTVKRSTLRCLELLDSHGLRNVFGIITKVGATDADIRFFCELKSVRVVVLVSYSGMPKSIEPYPTKPRIATLRRLREAGVPSVLYCRPIAEGWNDDLSNFRQLIRLGEKYADAIVIGGLRMSEEIAAELKRRQLPIPTESHSFNPKVLSNTSETMFMSAHSELNASVPVYKHTSCAVSYIFQRPNYNHLFTNPSANCLSVCPSAQQERCGVALAGGVGQ